MLKIGLTGGIGSGKTYVSNLFAELGIPIIDTDVIARDIVSDNQEVLQAISAAFGADVLKLNGELNRQKLAKIIFSNKENKQRLEGILHPEILREVDHQLKRLASSPKPPAYVIIVVPLLIEANYHEHIDRILAIIAEQALRIKRVQQRDNRSADEIQAIISSQVNDERRVEEADDIIENNGDLKSLAIRTRNLHEKYMDLSSTYR